MNDGNNFTKLSNYFPNCFYIFYSGLDTPDFGFNVLDPDNTLDPTDADFVDEIHTHVSLSSKGHADYFPNGGLSMPGCGNGLDKFLNFFELLFKGKTGGKFLLEVNCLPY